MKNILNLILISLFLFILTGCFSSNNDGINYFSINYPNPKPEKTNIINRDYIITVNPFSSNEHYGIKMVYSQPPNDILIDNSNCWAQKPSSLLTNYFAMYLGSRINSESKIKELSLSGKILELEGNLANSTTTLTIQLDLKNKSGDTILNKIYTEQSQMKKLSASAFAQSITTSLDAVASNFFNDLKDIK